jgi:YD repeat-containing protein
MRMIALTTALALLMTPGAEAQQRQFYDAAGRPAGRATTDSQGTTTMYGPDGRVIGRESGPRPAPIPPIPAKPPHHRRHPQEGEGGC